MSNSLQPQLLLDCSTPVFSILQYFPELARFMSIESLMLSNHLILCHSLLLLPSVFPSIRVFSSESVLHIRSPKYWHFSFSTSPSNEYSWLISFRIDWFDLHAVHGTQESSIAPQFGRINSSVLSLLYSPIFTSIHTTGKTVTLTIRTLVGKV